MAVAWAMALALLSPRVRAAAVGEVEPDLQLRLAVEYGDLSDAKAALAAGADVNAPVPGTGLNYTPLHQAVSKGHLEIARLLLEQGANPYLEDDNHDPVLVYVDPAKEGRAMLRVLLDWKVPIDSRNSDGNTALSRCLPWSNDTGYIALLLENGADPNLRLAGGTTPLMSAAKRSKAKTVALLSAAAGGWAAHVQLLISRPTIVRFQLSVVETVRQARLLHRVKTGDNRAAAGIGARGTMVGEAEHIARRFQGKG